MGSGHTLGERGGEQAHTLNISEIPTHTHVGNATNNTGNTPIPLNNILADSPSQLYATPANLVSLQPGTVTNTGGSQPHLNMQPFLTISFCIALQGIFPSPT